MDQEIQKRQLERSFRAAKSASKIEPPSAGWIHAIRRALNMPLETLARRMKLTTGAIRDIERREKEGSITLKSLRQAAAALDCQVVYFVIPNRDLDAILDREARNAAKKLTEGVSQTMSLEAQSTSVKEESDILADTIERLKQKPALIWRALR